MKLLLRVFYRLLYHEFAWSYDLVASLVSFGRWQDWVRKVLPYLAEGPILELGTGPGHLQQALVESGRRAFGIDLSPQMLAQASRRLLSAGCRPNLIRGDGRFLPFHANCVPNIAATFPTEYLFQPDTLKEIARVLTPTGKLIVLPTVFITGRGIVPRFVAWLYRVTGQTVPPDSLQEHPYLQFFEAAGFKVKQRLVDDRSASLLVIEASLSQTDQA